MKNHFVLHVIEKDHWALIVGTGIFIAAFLFDGKQAEAETNAEQQAKIVHTYKCEDGRSFRVRFDNTGNFFIAILDLAQAFEIPLIETVSGSGTRYSNEDYTLQTKDEEAVLTNQGNISVCSAIR